VPHAARIPDVDGLIRVGQIAELTGKTVRAIRFYEELGLIEPTARTQGGFREYDGSALTRIHWIDRLQELGFSLPEIREFLSSLRAQDSGPAAMDQLRAFYAQKLIDTRAAIRRLSSLEGEIAESLDYLHSCQSCAPATPRTACSACAEDGHRDAAAPPLVAAVHEARRSMRK
jgi:DNA-binding transcriptional MerR regulator